MKFRFTVLVDAIREHLSSAAEIAFFLLLSIFPGLLLVSSILTFLPGCADHYSDVRSILVSLLPTSAAGLVTETVREAHICATGGAGALGIGSLLLLWSGSRVFLATMRVLTRAEGAQERRPFWMRRLIAVAFLLGGVLAFALIFPALVLGGRLGSSVASAFELSPQFAAAWKLAIWPASVLLVLLGLALVYRFGPAWHLRRRAALIGAMTGTVCLIAVSLSFRQALLSYGRFGSYGVLAAVIILLIWSYAVSVSLLAGGLVAAQIQNYIGPQDRKIV